MSQLARAGPQLQRFLETVDRDTIIVTRERDLAQSRERRGARILVIRQALEQRLRLVEFALLEVHLTERLQRRRIVVIDGVRRLKRVDRVRDAACVVVQMALQVGPALVVRREPMRVLVRNRGGGDEILRVVSHCQLAVGGAER